MTTHTRIFQEWTRSREHPGHLIEGCPDNIPTTRSTVGEGGIASDRVLAVLPAGVGTDRECAVILTEHGTYLAGHRDVIDPDLLQRVITFMWVRPRGVRLRIILLLLDDQPDHPWMIPRGPDR
jgi:hypothetical protein